MWHGVHRDEWKALSRLWIQHGTVVENPGERHHVAVIILLKDPALP